MLDRKSYLICATPRSGSTLLCQMMINCGVAGQPKEYFEFLGNTGHPMQGPQYFSQKEMANVDDYVEIINILGGDVLRINHTRLDRWKEVGYCSDLRQILSAGTTSNGVFAAKMMWGYLDNFLELLKPFSVTATLNRHVVLNSVFPRLRYIRIQRIDKLRQAISLWRAIQSQQWRLDHDAKEFTCAREVFKRRPIYHFGAIRYLQEKLLRDDQSWDEFFLNNGLQPLTIVYEEFINDLKGTLSRVLGYLGIEVSPKQNNFIPPTMLQQRGMETESWVRRYVADETKGDNFRRSGVDYG